MMLDFDLSQVRHKEFGVGLDEGEGQSFRNMTVDDDTQTALLEMAVATWDAMQELSHNPSTYQPSEKYASLEYVSLPLSSDLAKYMRDLHQATSLPVDMNALSDPIKVFSYFSRMTDKQGRSLTALRRALHFKGVVKSRLVRVLTDALKLVEEPMFKLDHDFDLLIDSTTIHVLRPSGFESAGKLRAAILAAVPQNVQAIQNDLGFLDLTNIQDYAIKRPRAARYLASIRAEKQTENVDKHLLKDLCANMGVEISEANGTITVQDGHIMSFLEVLDRRRYGVELRQDNTEYFRAANRRKLNK